MRILLRAPLLTNSGYGMHCRQVFEWLDQLEGIDLTVECLNWGATSWLLKDSLENGLIGKIMQKSKKIEPPYDLSIQLQLPDEWDTKLGKKNIGMSAYVETDKCSEAWISKTNEMDLVIVPSQFIKKTIKNSGCTTTNIEVVPEWFNTNILTDNNDEDFIDLKTDFNFLIIGQLTALDSKCDRKNIINTIKTICETFKDKKDVGIVLKTSLGRGTCSDKKHTEQNVINLVNTFRKGTSPKLYLIHGNMDSKEIANIYNHPKVKCFVSATRGEGYGIPLVDAAASGMPVIATNWSGHLDFLNEKFNKIDYKMVNIPKEKVDNRIFKEGFMWAEPSLKSLEENLQNVYYNYNDAKIQAKSNKSFVIENFGKENIMSLYNKLIKPMIAKNE
jgi:glycosyltransferase involved in cell wall biosynthesis